MCLCIDPFICFEMDPLSNAMFLVVGVFLSFLFCFTGCVLFQLHFKCYNFLMGLTTFCLREHVDLFCCCFVF